MIGGETRNHSRSSEASDLIWPQMTLDDLDTWQVMYSVFLGAAFEFGTSFTLNNDPEVHGSYKVKIITSEMSR